MKLFNCQVTVLLVIALAHSIIMPQLALAVRAKAAEQVQSSQCCQWYGTYPNQDPKGSDINVGNSNVYFDTSNGFPILTKPVDTDGDGETDFNEYLAFCLGECNGGACTANFYGAHAVCECR